MKPEATKPAMKSAREKTKDTEKSATKERPAALADRADGVLTLAVSLNKQQLTLYSDGSPIARSRVSVGVPDAYGDFQRHPKGTLPPFGYIRRCPLHAADYQVGGGYLSIRSPS